MTPPSKMLKHTQTHANARAHTHKQTNKPQKKGKKTLFAKYAAACCRKLLRCGGNSRTSETDGCQKQHNQKTSKNKGTQKEKSKQTTENSTF